MSAYDDAVQWLRARESAEAVFGDVRARDLTSSRADAGVLL